MVPLDRLRLGSWLYNPAVAAVFVVLLVSSVGWFDSWGSPGGLLTLPGELLMRGFFQLVDSFSFLLFFGYLYALSVVLGNLYRTAGSVTDWTE